jgi:hypothetical protein
MKCPDHGVDYQIVKTDYEQLGIIVKDVKALRCPVDGEILFTLQQAEAIRRKISSLAPAVKLVAKITRAAGKPSIYLPPEIVKQAGLKIGQEVEVYLADKRKIVIEAAG